MKTLVLIISSFLLFSVNSLAFEINRKNHSFDISLDIYTKHLWRGFSNGTSPSLQPSLGYSKGNFSVGVWAAMNLNRSYHELDLFASYTFGSFTATVYDYYCPVLPLKNNEFFEITQGKTRHTLDVNIEYAQPDKHPFSLLVATMVYGDDLNPDNGKNYYSTYIEPSINFTVLKNYKLLLFTGLTPFKSYYADKTAIVNTGISVNRVFLIKEKFELGSSFKVSYNPAKNQCWLSIGISI